MILLANPALIDFWRDPRPIKILYGGRSSSKTMDTAIQVVLAMQHGRINVVCLRKFQSSISRSVYEEIRRAARLLGIDSSFQFNKTEITHKFTGSKAIFMGVARNTQEIKGISDAMITWIEEAQFLLKEEWMLIQPTIQREQGSVVIMLFNTDEESDFVYDSFIVKQDHSNVCVRKINYLENPFLSQTALDMIESVKANYPEDYDLHYLGNPRTQNPDSVISRSNLLKCVDAHLTTSLNFNGDNRVGFDPSDGGVDNCALAYMSGSVLLDAVDWLPNKDELHRTIKTASDYATERYAKLIYDPLSVGAGVAPELSRLGNFNVSKFIASESVQDPSMMYAQTGIANKDYFQNAKAQAWINLSRRVNNTARAVSHPDSCPRFLPSDIFSLSSEIKGIDKLIKELTTPRMVESSDRKKMIEKKTDLKKRGIESHNIADAVVMASFKSSNQW